jgi:hypothetical protein
MQEVTRREPELNGLLRLARKHEASALYLTAFGRNHRASSRSDFEYRAQKDAKRRRRRRVYARRWPRRVPIPLECVKDGRPAQSGCALAGQALIQRSRSPRPVQSYSSERPWSASRLPKTKGFARADAPRGARHPRGHVLLRSSFPHALDDGRLAGGPCGRGQLTLLDCPCVPALQSQLAEVKSSS